MRLVIPRMVEFVRGELRLVGWPLGTPLVASRTRPEPLRFNWWRAAAWTDSVGPDH